MYDYFIKIVNDDFNTIKSDHFKLVGDYFITIIGHFRIATNYLKVLKLFDYNNLSKNFKKNKI